jgi:hypothetical protein
MSKPKAFTPLELHTTAARCEPPLAPSRRRLTMTNSLNRYGDGVTELRHRQGLVGLLPSYRTSR